MIGSVIRSSTGVPARRRSPRGKRPVSPAVRADPIGRHRYSPTMTDYHARWHDVLIEARIPRMFARTVDSISRLAKATDHDAADTPCSTAVRASDVAIGVASAASASADPSLAAAAASSISIAPGSSTAGGATAAPDAPAAARFEIAAHDEPDSFEYEPQHFAELDGLASDVGEPAAHSAQARPPSSRESAAGPGTIHEPGPLPAPESAAPISPIFAGFDLAAASIFTERSGSAEADVGADVDLAPVRHEAAACASQGTDAFDELIAIAGMTVDAVHQDDPMLSSRSMLPLVDEEDPDPLAALAREYQRTLLGGEPRSAHGLKAAASASVEHALPVATARNIFDRHAAPPGHDASVFDLLTKDKNIDALLDELDTFGANHLFEPEPRHEILSLLAPRGVRASLAAQTAQLARAEHHLISLDSHLAMSDPTAPFDDDKH
ncbi:hypothetical protein Y5A_018600 [Burkholderia glumae AU6208]|nr:hypothetical protein Y5A_018600 [Burkholderia glumae AU6208]